MALVALGKFLRCSLKDDVATAIASLYAEVYNVVGTLYNLHIMLHNHYRMSRHYQGIEGLQEAIYVVYMQSRRRLVKDKHHSLVGKLAREVRGQLNALALATRKC